MTVPEKAPDRTTLIREAFVRVMDDSKGMMPQAEVAAFVGMMFEASPVEVLLSIGTERAKREAAAHG